MNFYLAAERHVQMDEQQPDAEMDDQQSDAEMDEQEEETAEMDEHAEQGGQREVRHRKSLSDRDRYAAYVAMHALCMRNGGKFKRNDKKDIAEFFKVDIQIIQII